MRGLAHGITRKSIFTGLTRSVSSSGGSSFDPMSYPNLALALDASDLTTLFQDSAGTTPVTANNQRVGRWLDLSGSNNHVIQAVADGRPWYRATGFMGAPALQFAPGEYDWNYLQSPSMFSSAWDNAITLFTLTSQVGSGWRIVASASNQRFSFAHYQDYEQFDTNQLSVAMRRIGAQVLAGEIRATGISYDGTTFRTITNGFYQERPVTGNLGLSGLFSIGNNSSPMDNNMRGYMPLLYLYRTSFTEAQMRAMCNYMLSRFGLSTPVLRVVACDGDSLTIGPTLETNWVAQLSNTMTNVGQSFHNFGIGGAGIAYLSEIAASRVDPLLDANPGRSVCVIWAGSNDVANPSEDTIANIGTYYQAYCNARRAAGWDHIIVATLLPRSATGDSPNVETRRQAFNTWLRSNYTSFADTLVDLAADSRIGDAGDQLNTTNYSTDQVHLTAAGETIVMGLFQPAITAALG